MRYTEPASIRQPPLPAGFERVVPSRPRPLAAMRDRPTLIVDGVQWMPPPGRGPRWPDPEPPPGMRRPSRPGPHGPLEPACRGERFALPPFLDAAWFTQACFEQATLAGRNDQWPATTCTPPCLSPRACALPSAASIQRAKDTFDIYLPPQSFLTIGDGRVFQAVLPQDVLPGPVRLVEPLALLLGGDVGRTHDLIYAALALMLDNLDILEWVVCLVDEWSAQAPPQWVPGAASGEYNTGAILPCMLDAMSGAHAVYFIQSYGLDRSGAPENATGGAVWEDSPVDDFATAVDEAGLPNGVVIPVGNSYWRRLARRYGEGLPASRALCAVLVASEILLHEMLHICVSGEREPSDCWQLQHMAANSWQWAMGERYSCLQDNPCCPRVDPFFFMNAEPQFLVRTGLYTAAIPATPSSDPIPLEPVLKKSIRNPSPYDKDAPGC